VVFAAIPLAFLAAKAALEQLFLDIRCSIYFGLESAFAGGSRMRQALDERSRLKPLTRFRIVRTLIGDDGER
jgi:hypothetical protein